jgi:hypothetical protein
MENWQTEMEKKLDETHDMVKRMYQHLFGTEEYKDGSLMVKIAIMEEQIEILKNERIERNSSIKTTKNIMRILWSVIGVLATAFGSIVYYVLNHFVK